VTWISEGFFDQLENIQKEAKTLGEPIDGMLINSDSDDSWDDSWGFKMLTHGNRGYAFILVANDFTFKIAKIEDPGTMPNVLVEIRSETLWTLGIKEAVNRIKKIINWYARSTNKIKPSRVDLCVDLEMPEEEWSIELKKKRVCRTLKIHCIEGKEGEKDILETMIIGVGDLTARIYDKEKEIREHSGKYWMYELWGIEKAKEGTKIIRVEFQIRRPILKTFGIDDIEDLYREMNALWAYLTQNWLKFLKKPEKNKGRQRVHPWWKAVQGGFGVVCKPSERIRHIAIRMEQDQLTKRSLTFLENLMASEIAATRMPKDAEYTLEDSWKLLVWQRNRMGLNDVEFSNNVKKKVVNYQRQDNEKVPF
jgi:hypothetical protein